MFVLKEGIVEGLGEEYTALLDTCNPDHIALGSDQENGEEFTQMKVWIMILHCPGTPISSNLFLVHSLKINTKSVKIKSFSYENSDFHVKINSVRENQNFSRKCELLGFGFPRDNNRLCKNTLQ